MYRGVLGGGVIEVFPVVDLEPALQPSFTIDKTLLKLTSLTIVDYQVLPSGEVWILDATTGAYQVVYKNEAYVLGSLSIGRRQGEATSFTGMLVVQDFSYANAYAVFLSGEAKTVYHYVVQLNPTPVPVVLLGKYVLPEVLKTVNGVPIDISADKEFVTVAISANSVVYLFPRGKIIVNSPIKDPFTHYYTQKFNKKYAALNQLPGALLFDNNFIQMGFFA